MHTEPHSHLASVNTFVPPALIYERFLSSSACLLTMHCECITKSFISSLTLLPILFTNETEIFIRRITVSSYQSCWRKTTISVRTRRERNAIFCIKSPVSSQVETNFLSNFTASDSRLGFKFSGNSSRTDWCGGGGGGGGGEEDQIIVRLDHISGERKQLAQADTSLVTGGLQSAGEGIQLLK